MNWFWTPTKHFPQNWTIQGCFSCSVPLESIFLKPKVLGSHDLLAPCYSSWLLSPGSPNTVSRVCTLLHSLQFLEQSRNKAITPHFLTNGVQQHQQKGILCSTGWFFFLLLAKQLFHVGVHPGKLSTLNFQLMNQKQKLHLTKPTFDPASKLYLDLLWFSHR